MRASTSATGLAQRATWIAPWLIATAFSLGGLGNPTRAGATVTSPPSLSKAFDPTHIPSGGTSTLTFTITNPNPSSMLTTIAA